MFATFKRTKPQNVLRRPKKSMRPLLIGTPKFIQHIEWLADNADAYITSLAQSAAEDLTEEFRNRAKAHPRWMHLADKVSIEFDESSYKFNLTASDDVIEEVRELERTKDTLFTQFAGEYLNDQENSNLVVSTINTSSPIGRTSAQISKKIKSDLLPTSGVTHVG